MTYVAGPLVLEGPYAPAPLPLARPFRSIPPFAHIYYTNEYYLKSVKVTFVSSFFQKPAKRRLECHLVIKRGNSSGHPCHLPQAAQNKRRCGSAWLSTHLCA